MRFATTGNPAGGQLADWPCYDPHRRAVMMLDEEPYLCDDPDQRRRLLWHDLAL